MPLPFEKLQVHQTWLGELMLQRRYEPILGGQAVLEITLDGRQLMSSVVNDSEIALANLGLAAVADKAMDVVVGGLGLGCTAAAALAFPELRSLLVVDCLHEVIDWHNRGVVPLGAQLVNDPRCRFVHGDFFAMVNHTGTGFDPDKPGRRFHAILMDIDHSPRGLLHGSHQEFYQVEGLRLVVARLYPGGVFALWSADPPEPEFLDALGQVFAEHQVHEVEFQNPLLGIDDLNTVYVARTAALAE